MGSVVPSVVYFFAVYMYMRGWMDECVMVFVLR